jgi:hypothetical protein
MCDCDSQPPKLGNDPKADFDGDDAVEACVAGAIDLSDAAGPDSGLNFVRSYPTLRTEWHEYRGSYLGSNFAGAGVLRP